MKKLFYETLTLIFITTLIASCSGPNEIVGFRTKGRQLLDANNQPFMIRGINNPNIWFGDVAYDALDAIAETGANCVRIVWQANGTAEDLDPILKRCVDLKMVPMIELHDVTGDTTCTKLTMMANYYLQSDVKKVLMRYEKYLLLNIANEWGDHTTKDTYWRDSYLRCINLLREGGYNTTIVIDAPGWGQNIDPILNRGQQLINADPLHNILFSIHMYGSWNSSDRIVEKLKNAAAKKLPLIVGEFGYNYADGANNLNCQVDYETILKTCDELEYGYLPWSWTGNNEANQWLDMVDIKDWKTLTPWGVSLIESEFGIRRTSRPASIFNK